jgi:hypothetical protein
VSIRPPTSRKLIVLSIVAALTPAVLVLTWYSLRQRSNQERLQRQLTPGAMRLLKSAETLGAYHLGRPEEVTTATARLAGQAVVQQSPALDGYFLMRLRKALLAPGNLIDARSPCSGPPQLAFEFADASSTATILLNFVCQNVRAVEVGPGNKVLSQGSATLSPLGIDQLRFLEAEAFQPR